MGDYEWEEEGRRGRVEDEGTGKENEGGDRRGHKERMRKRRKRIGERKIKEEWKRGKGIEKRKRRK